MPSIRVDLYQSVTDTIIAGLEAGTPPWVPPWRGAGVSMAPRNLTSCRPYRGINVLLLNLRAIACGFATNRWLTFQQARTLGAHVRRGEEGTPIVFFKMHDLDAKDRSGAEDRKVVPLLKRFVVFNASQVDGLPAGIVPAPVTDSIWDPCGVAEGLLEASGAVIRHGGNQAFYAPDSDVVQLPERGAFMSAEDYYSTALHELTHWTGHPTRCDRPLGVRHGIDAYAFEELVAEMGSAFLTTHCHLPGQFQHASYIASWLKALRNDKRLIFRAASLAQKASDFLIGEQPAAQQEAA